MIRMNFKFLSKISRQWLGIITVNIMLMTGVFYLLALSTPHNATDAPTIETRLNDIQSRVISLQNEVKKPVEKIDLKEINQDFNKLAALIEQLKSKDDAQLNQLVHESRTELSNKLNAIHQTIDSLDKKQHLIKYLPITALPFQVVSIDSIQQVSVASVAYDYKTIPLERNDSLAGWTVVKIDFGKQQLEFENANKERVLVNLDINQDEQHA